MRKRDLKWLESVGVHRYRGLLVLILWQAMPVGTYTDDAGRTRIGFGFGAAQFENVTFDCAGNPTSVERGRARAGGVQLETFVAPQWRLSASAGAVDDSYPTGRDPALTAVGSAMVVHEGPRLALGGGVAVLPRRGYRPYGEWGWEYMEPANASTHLVLPAAHLRLGAERLHFRADMLAPAPALGALGELRAGVGFGAGQTQRGVRGFGGVALCHFCFNDATGSSNASAFLELGIPLQRSFDIDVGALVGPGRENANLGLTLGGRMYLGSPARRAPARPVLPENGAY
jgi:hypothetical protein